MTWSSWIDVEIGSDHDGNSVYRIRLTVDGVPVSISRFLGSDCGGLLSIGKTTNMEERRRQFVRALGGTFGHSEGNLLHFLEQYSPLRNKYPKQRFEYSFCRIDNLADVDLFEEALIKAYVRKFGEVPPLNSAIPRRYEVKTWQLAGTEPFSGAV